MPPDRRRDRHISDKQTGISARLDNPDFGRLEAVRTRRGISRRKAIIEAIRDWVARHESDDLSG
jgi:hypothetical protein